MPWLGLPITKQIGRGFFGVPAHLLHLCHKKFLTAFTVALARTSCSNSKQSRRLVLSNNSQQIECNVFFIEAILNEACVVVSSHSVSVIPCSVLLRELLLANTV